MYQVLINGYIFMKKLFLVLFFLPIVVLICAQEPDGNIVIEKDNAWIRVPANEKSQVMLAVQALQKDFKKVMNFTPDIVQSGETGTGLRIVIVNDENPDGKALILSPRNLDDFESHRIYVDQSSGSIVVYVTYRRGTICAIRTVSERISGVPPLW